jgi:uncharacterized surface protein with fasciclin (FAS1) repeats
MFGRIAGSVVAAAALATLAPAPSAAQGHGQASPAAGSTILEVAAKAGNFNTLVAAVRAAGLAETLSGGGPFTVFAPTDEAFAKLPAGTVEALLKDQEKLAAILTYHVVSGKVTADKVVGLTSATTVNGKAVGIKVSGGKVMVGNANVTTTDIMASNGVIHVIDSVLLP